jgi:hypothetical protein
VTPRRRSLTALAAVTTLAALTLTACGDDEGDTDESTEPAANGSASSPPPTPPAGIQLNVGSWAPGDDAMEALLKGVVSIGASGCIYVHVGPGSSNKPANIVDVVWPEGTSVQQVGTGPIEIWNADNEAIARIGTRVSVGGGAPSTQAAADLTCQAGDKAAFFINDELPVLPEG